MKNILGKIYRHVKSLLISFRLRPVSRSAFYQNWKEARDHYLKKINSYNFSAFVIPKWKANMEEMERYFIEKFSFNFLNRRVITHTMFIYTSGLWKKVQLDFIKAFFPLEKAHELLREYSLGRPLLSDMQFATSGNTLHHLYHLAKFSHETGLNFQDLNNIVEVGGGYGNMARIFKQLNASATYTIVDLPVFSYIQLVYLQTILGNKAVNLVEKDNCHIEPGKVNIIPLDKELLVELAPKIACDLFISTWALSESNKNMQDLIKSLHYFNAENILLAYQRSNADFSQAEEVQNIGDRYIKVYDQETAYIKDNYYLFCRKTPQTVDF